VRRDYKAALADYDKALEIDPQSIEALHDRGLVYIDQTQYDKAVADFTAVLQIDPLNIDALIERAHAYDKKTNRTAASNDLKRALALARTPTDRTRVQAEIDRLQQ